VLMLTHRAGDGGQKARCTEESAYKLVETVAQGRPVVRPILWYLPPAFFTQAGHGCGLHPAFPIGVKFILESWNHT